MIKYSIEYSEVITMHRLAMQNLIQWKENKKKKPLIIRGARQVGKTWLMKKFGETEYENYLYINFENNQQMQNLFSTDMDIERIIIGIEIYTGHKINPANSLLIFDEIQEVPQALTALKYFNENAPQLNIICAGSLLGIALHPGTSFPVGKVEFMDLFPLNFIEFLLAMGKKQLADLIQKKSFKLITSFKQNYIDMLKYYYYVGGMPEVVKAFSENMDFSEVIGIQKQILSTYEQDFSKHAPGNVVPRIRMLWNSIPSQLSKENKKFIYGLIKKGSRAKEYELALLWLIDCGLVYKTNRISKPALPLKAYEDLKAFKLYLLDIGLLSCMVRLNHKTILDGSKLFNEFKGALTEQYVLQQLNTIPGIELYYWSNDKGTAELDFIIDNGNRIYPVEVKAEVNLQAKSLKSYRDRFKPEKSIRISMSDYKEEDWLLNLPLYAIELIN
jgi:predicted AAA+ superfamily ATPase